jgi:hypothetical protein
VGGSTALALTAFLSAGTAHAVDGVIEINQTKVIAGSITPGDAANFPAALTVSGSYRLTSDLTAPAGVDGISVTASNVTIDLNGFTIYSGGGGVADGISVPSVRNVEIKNGTVIGFSRSGIFTNGTTHHIRVIGVRAIANATIGIDLQGESNTVDGCQVLNNGTGIRVGLSSLVINTVVRGHPFLGLVMTSTAGYGSNVLTGNNGGDANPQVSGGFQIGTNVCGSDTICP